MNDVTSRMMVYVSLFPVSTALSSNNSIHVTHHCKCILKYKKDNTNIDSITGSETPHFHLPFVPRPQASYVTGFAKRGLIHASNFSTLKICNSTLA